MTNATERAMKPKRHERSIMFTDPMVIAIEELRKSMTRRLIVPQPTNRMVWDELNHQLWDPGDEDGCVVADPINSPFHVGDLLWVKQGVRCVDTTRLIQGRNGGWLWPKWAPDAGYQWFRGNCYYTARSKETDGVLLNKMFMPKYAARLWLEIVGVKVERVTEITPADALAEGIDLPVPAGCEAAGRKFPDGFEAWSEKRKDEWFQATARSIYFARCADAEDHITAFRDLWESIHGRGSWSLNPWVWALTFRPVAPAGDGKGNQ